MKIYEIQNRNTSLLETLLNIWESSVKATHLFLSDEEIGKIKEYVPDALKNVQHLIVAQNDYAKLIAFMGIENYRLEMLFVHPLYIGNGFGKQLIHYGIENYKIQEVTVNEQNPQAVDFYKHMGFKIYNRTDYDEQGNRYPLLYMKLI